MPSRTTFLASGLAIPLAALVWIGSAEEKRTDPDDELDRFVAAAVERLASPDRATRLAAERELIERGPLVLERLPAPQHYGPRHAAVNAAIERIRKRLEEQMALEAVLRPKLVTFEADGGIDDDGAVSLNLSLTSEQSQRRVTLSHQDQPYWTVIDDFAAQAALWPEGTDFNDRLIFRDRTPADDAKRVDSSGTFRLAAGPVSLRPIAGDEDRRLVRVPLELRSEPRLRPLFVSYSAADLQLVTADGKTLPPFTPGAKYELPFGEKGDAVDLRLDFVAPADEIQEPLKLTGTLTVTVAASENPFWFDLGAAQGPFSDQHQSRGGVTVRVRDAALNPNGSAEVELSVVYDEGGPAFESHRTWVYHNVAYLEYVIERDGEPTLIRLDHEPGFSTVAQADSGVILRYRFAGIPPEANHVRFVYEAPTGIVEVPVEIEVGGLTIGML